MTAALNFIMIALLKLAFSVNKCESVMYTFSDVFLLPHSFNHFGFCPRTFLLYVGMPQWLVVCSQYFIYESLFEDAPVKKKKEVTQLDGSSAWSSETIYRAEELKLPNTVWVSALAVQCILGWMQRSRSSVYVSRSAMHSYALEAFRTFQRSWIRCFLLVKDLRCVFFALKSSNRRETFSLDALSLERLDCFHYCTSVKVNKLPSYSLLSIAYFQQFRLLLTLL